ncbi:GntR family transcriptional regulator [uncultured Psychrosphaera sp.]|uniref:GntR family transcriptional regulator n=1 Tax=uncultured Psychrosphaera sp. TaxID=1403522 RepID=UPI002628DAA7|nr:GntR family transcriptional regulator [uncultured Psychrosphaera sp.]
MNNKHFVTMLNQYPKLKNLVIYIKGNIKLNEALPGQDILKEIIGYSKQQLRESLIMLQCFGYISINHGKKTKLIKEIDV